MQTTPVPFDFLARLLSVRDNVWSTRKPEAPEVSEACFRLGDALRSAPVLFLTR